jgi:hypothetical protein
MKILKISILALAITAITACAGPRIITGNENTVSITIQDTAMTTAGSLEKGAIVAKEHCAKYGKEANFERTEGLLGLPSIAFFKCI